MQTRAGSHNITLGTWYYVEHAARARQPSVVVGVAVSFIAGVLSVAESRSWVVRFLPVQSPAQKVGGVLAEMISQGSVPVLRNRCGIALVK